MSHPVGFFQVQFDMSGGGGLLTIIDAIRTNAVSLAARPTFARPNVDDTGEPSRTPAAATAVQERR
jgi:hypothetical protein